MPRFAASYGKRALRFAARAGVASLRQSLSTGPVPNCAADASSVTGEIRQLAQCFLSPALLKQQRRSRVRRIDP